MSNRTVDFEQIDVFTHIPYTGNPVAVILDGDNLTTSEMQKIANWTHLSETTFVCRPKNPDADYLLRIFSPQNELPFAGHPTIGSAFAVLKSGIVPKNKDCLIQECGTGLVKIYQKEHKLFLTLPEPKMNSVSEDCLLDLANALGVDYRDVLISQTIDVGAVWHTIMLKNADQVLSIQPDMNLLAKAIKPGITGLTIFWGYSSNNNVDFEVRSFAPNEGANEDPVCGSGNGCVAVLVRAHNLVNGDEYIVSQGTCVGRHGYVYVKLINEFSILVGGEAVTCIEGNLSY